MRILFSLVTVELSILLRTIFHLYALREIPSMENILLYKYYQDNQLQISAPFSVFVYRRHDLPQSLCPVAPHVISSMP